HAVGTPARATYAARNLPLQPRHRRLAIVADDLFFFIVALAAEIYTLSLHDALPISAGGDVARSRAHRAARTGRGAGGPRAVRAGSEEHTSELQSLRHLVCRLLLEKKKRAARRAGRARDGTEQRALRC